ncbi:LtrC (plasmid) [Bacillus methanolicus]|uniref:ArdC-like ssDNA-binding domain-containing protein n=1 Tax=Bacillus methanolicus TaxID=1471 RepID=UPI002380BB09|nr:ArdC-like ssDNA-binding domain-containing protein [Bacillus methanolicus]MDE3840963.1 LtrC [Bacillus methanolicus]
MANHQNKNCRKWNKDGPSVEEKVKELVSILEEGVKNFSYSPEEFKALLEMKALMPNYSFRNIMVAKAQYPNASFFAPLKRWNELGRKVKKGSKAIRIFKPRFKEVETEDGTGEVETKLIGFLTVPVFAYEQTEGEPLPIDKVIINLEGDCPEARQIIEYAEQIARKDNCSVIYGDAEGANGYYQPSKHEIVVSEALSINHRCKTLIHELVHSKVHRYDTSSSTSEKEVVAEGAAFVVCSFFGLDTSDYSFRYVKSWSKNDEDSLLKYGSQICDISGRIIEEFRRLMEEKAEKGLQTA